MVMILSPSTIYGLLLIAVCWLVALALIFGVLIEDDPQERQPGVILRIVRWTRARPGACSPILKHILGRRIHSRLNRLCHYCWMKPNPILPIIYLIIMQTILAITIWHLLPFMNALSTFGFISLYVACLYSFVSCWFSLPGRINASNHAACLDYYRFDEVMFRPGVICRTCRLEKVARSKHCSFCNICVARYDHHCVWLNNCIGANNIGRFVLFLAIKTLSCIYMIVLLGSIANQIIQEKGLLTRTLVTRTGTVVPNSWLNIFRHILGHYPLIVVLIIFLVPTAVFLGIFSIYHTRMLMSNITTNESVKLEHMKAANSEFYFRQSGGSIISSLRETLFMKFPVK